MGKSIEGKWPRYRTTAGLDNSTEFRTEKIHPAVSEIKFCLPMATPIGANDPDAAQLQI